MYYFASSLKFLIEGCVFDLRDNGSHFWCLDWSFSSEIHLKDI